MKIKKVNAVARDLRTPKYRPRVERDRKREARNGLSRHRSKSWADATSAT